MTAGKYKIAITVFVLCATLIISCSKEKGAYYNYQNNQKTINGSAYDFLTSQKGVYDSFLLVINRVTGLSDSLKTHTNMTLFAVPNTCFTIALQNLNEARTQAVPQRAALSLSTLDSTQLDTLVYRYLIPGTFTADTLKTVQDGFTVNCLKYGYAMHLKYIKNSASGWDGGGPSAIAFSDMKGSIFERDWVTTPTASVNIKTNNAVVHVLSAGHDFGFGSEFITRMNK